ncbi:MAG: cytochrome C, partial [Burkholderiaceae bacterium]
YGATLHNNPTSQDVWNSTPAFGFPYTTSPLASTPAAATLIDGGLAQQVAGLGGYLFWKKSLYGEVSFYRTADGAFSILRQGQDIHTDGGVAALKGYNPYWRFAYSQDWGPNSIMVGTYGMVADRYPSNFDTSTPTDRFRDIAIDAQYQYITDPHTFTAQVTYIDEKQSYNASFPATTETGAGIGAGPTPANPTDKLHTFKAKATYYNDRKYGGTLAYFSTTGSADSGLYGMDPNGNAMKPDSRGYIVELDYLPIQNIRLMLQYTAYNKFNGASINFDGNGRNARDNNTAFFNVWVAF